MNAKELFELCFKGKPEIIGHYFYEGGGFPVAIEEKGKTIACAMVFPRHVRAPNLDDRLAEEVGDPERVAVVAGLCVHPDRLAEGLEAALIKKVIRVSRELGFCAIFLHPTVPKFSAEFGFVDVMYTEPVRIRESRFDGYTAGRYCGEDARGSKYHYGMDDVAYQIITQINACNADKIGLAFTYQDFLRLAKEAELYDGLYLISGEYGAVAAALKKGDTVKYVWTRSGRPELILSKTTYNGVHIFAGCTLRLLLSDKAGMEDPSVYLQLLVLDEEIYRKCIAAGQPHPEELPYRFIENYSFNY